MAPVINIVIDATNNTGAVFTQVQTGLRGVASTTQQTTATMNAAFMGVGNQILGGLGIATGIGQVTGELRQLASEGQNVQASLDRTRGSLGAVLGDQARANDIFEQASRFADRYSLTQSEMAGAIQASSQIIRTSQQPIENIMGTLARLQVLSPEQGLEGAALAMRELTSGDTRSLVGRFEVSRDAANAMKREIMGGADAVQVLDRYLTSAGITDGALEASLAGAAGEQREWNRAVEQLGLQINDVVSSAGWREFATGLINATTNEISALQNLGQWIDRIGAQSNAVNPVIGQLNQIENILSSPLHSFGRWLGLETDPRLSEKLDLHDRHPTTAAPVAQTPVAGPTRDPVRFAGFASEPDALGRVAISQGRSLTAPQTRGLPAEQTPFTMSREARGVTAEQMRTLAAPQSRGLPPEQMRPTAASGQSAGPRSAHITVNIYPQGLVHSSRDLADYMRDAARDDSFRNAIEVLGNR